MSRDTIKMEYIFALFVLVFLKPEVAANRKAILPPISNLISGNHHRYQKDTESNQILDNSSPSDVSVIVDRITRLESIVLDHRLKVEKYQDEIKEEVKVMRNATLLLLSLVSGGGSECQGLKDTASKVKILYAALAAYEPSLNYPKFDKEVVLEEEEIQPSPDVVVEEEKTKTIEAELETFPSTVTSPEGDVEEEPGTPEIGLESDDLIWESPQESTISTISAETSPPPATTSSSSTMTATTTPETFSSTTITTLATTTNTTLHSNAMRGRMKSSKPSIGSYWTLWVGATDQEKEGEWHWVTGGPLNLNESSRWDVEEAAEVGENQDCLAMILWVPGRWQRWDLLDDPCDLEWFFFCEYSP